MVNGLKAQKNLAQGKRSDTLGIKNRWFMSPCKGKRLDQVE